MKVSRPGFEVKSACSAAEKVGAKLEFMGPELNQKTWDRVMHEHRLANFLTYVSRLFQYRDTEYTDENEVLKSKLRNVGASAFTEKCLDTYTINWYIQATDIYFP